MRLSIKKGSENVVVDALSRTNHGGALLQMAVSTIASYVWDKVKESCKWQYQLLQVMFGMLNSEFSH